jgi:hypothetical protein
MQNAGSQISDSVFHTGSLIHVVSSNASRHLIKCIEQLTAYGRERTFWNRTIIFEEVSESPNGGQLLTEHPDPCLPCYQMRIQHRSDGRMAIMQVCLGPS